jgi:hypothetical protein
MPIDIPPPVVAYLRDSLWALLAFRDFPSTHCDTNVIFALNNYQY